MKIDFSLSDDQGPVSQKPGKLFGLGKPQQNLQLYDYKAVLYTEIHFIQEVSSAYTSPLLATDGLKVTLRARQGSGFWSMFYCLNFIWVFPIKYY